MTEKTKTFAYMNSLNKKELIDAINTYINTFKQFKPITNKYTSTKEKEFAKLNNYKKLNLGFFVRSLPNSLRSYTWCNNGLKRNSIYLFVDKNDTKFICVERNGGDIVHLSTKLGITTLRKIYSSFIIDGYDPKDIVKGQKIQTILNRILKQLKSYMIIDSECDNYYNIFKYTDLIYDSQVQTLTVRYVKSKLNKDSLKLEQSSSYLNTYRTNYEIKNKIDSILRKKRMNKKEFEKFVNGLKNNAVKRIEDNIKNTISCYQ